MSARQVPRATLDAQAEASDPGSSAWVSANAGSGKTHVLAQRVIRLLLDGTEPSKILCLTYTRAAAANMASRVFKTLAAWCVLPDEELTAAIVGMTGRAAPRGSLAKARRLFAEALETPGGLKIQTIHAFCEAVLHQFPLEANIAGHFELLDPQMEAALVAEARRDMVTGASAGDNPALAEAFASVLERGGEDGLNRLLAEIVERRDLLRRLIDEIGNDPIPYSALFEEFGFSPDATEEDITRAAWPVPGFSPPQFSEFVSVAEAIPAKRVLDWIVPAAALAFAEPHPVRRLERLVEGFLNGKGEPYAASTFAKPMLQRLPDIAERYAQAAMAIRAAADRLALHRMLASTRAALVIADWLIGRYERLKHARGFLDFNDLIVKTGHLLSRPDAGPWVQYKLDRGIDHVLIDEAQDTSPGQWDVVKRLAAEFFVGAGARDRVTRTIFAVGDEKQSIYSFQGAEPAAFAANRFEFQQKVADAGGRFAPVRLRHSFRSTEDVLKLVDAVFADEDARRGLTRDPEDIVHETVRAGAPGYVELWPPLAPEQVEEPDDWREAIDHASAPAVRLAGAIAATIGGWLAQGETIEGKDRGLRPGDVMVLVRKRGPFVQALSRALKDRHIAVAGADRLSLPGHIAVQDLAALGRFVLQPHDDLSLAGLLKSPAFGLSEDRLRDLAVGRPGSLFDALRIAGASDSALGEVVARLDKWRNEAGYRPVFDFFAGVLARDGVRARMIARLGREAGDVLDEFLSFCLAAEKTGLPGLESFLATLQNAGPEIKREMDQARDEVRIMTVHAAKGLEAPVVFLVDNGSAPFHDSHLPRLVPFEPTKGLWQGRGVLWRAASDMANPASRGVERLIRSKAEEEYRRLLYVGMTRAEDRLIVCGYQGSRPASGTWHHLVGAAFGRADGIAERSHAVLGADATVKRFRVGPAAATEASSASPRAAPIAAASVRLPPELAEPLPPAPVLPRPLAPSGASSVIEPEAAGGLRSSASPVLDLQRAASRAMERGTAVHRLLQMLPAMPPGDREAAALRYLSRIGRDWSEADRHDAWRGVARVLDAPMFAPVFAPEARAEVSIMGRLKIGGQERAISGKIDRLAVDGNRALIVDYKTGRPTPASLAEVPAAHVAQLALYRALLQPLYPGRPVEAALLFTEAPVMIPLPQDVMDAALARLGVS